MGRTRLIDLTGQRFGRLTVLHREPVGLSRSPRWVCRCDCGEVRTVLGPHLRSGVTRSCGCLHREVITMHGHAARGATSRVYQSWGNAIARCENPRATGFGLYGGRGLRMCARWRGSFAAFAADMGPRPLGHQLDRTDNARGYECGSPDCPDCGPLGLPMNGRWVTPKAQARNRRDNRLVTLDGVVACVAAHAEARGVPPSTARHRLRRGLPVAEAFARPTPRGMAA